MAFKIASTLDGIQAPFEYYLGKDAEAYTLGEALVMAGGRLTKCGATQSPEFICVRTQAAEATAVTPIPVYRVTETMEFETTMGEVSSEPAAIALGSKLTLHNDGLSCSYVTANGVFTVSGLTNTGNAVAGDKVAGYFRR